MKKGGHLIRRKETWHLRRRVPKRYAAVEPRKELSISLATDSREIAEDKAPRVWDLQIAGWEAALEGNNPESKDYIERARDLAERRGYRFLSTKQIARLSAVEIVERVEAAHDKLGRPIPAMVDAVLGAAQPPDVTVSRALDLYWDLTSEKLVGKNEDQIRIWRNARKRPVTTFLREIGDLNLKDILSEDMQAFRRIYQKRVEASEIKAGTANKEIGHFCHILRTVVKLNHMPIQLPIEDLGLADVRAPTIRPPFSTSWIKTRLLAPGALSGLNTEARCLLIGMINTGYRPSEGSGLLADDIVLDAEIPHIKIHDEHRTLKTHTSKRVIPLAGVSLQAFQECPGGFERYRGTSNLNAAVNKFLKEHELRETPDHTMYSLRHSFEDRMLNADIDERIRRDLMGHTLTNRERYGRGASLEKLAEVIDLVAL